MTDAQGRAGGSKPLHFVDGVLRDEAPPRSEQRKIIGMEATRPDGRFVVSHGPARSRPAFPQRPLNPASVEPADLPDAEKAEVVRLVRLVQTDFDPEKDPRGWDAVAELVRGSGRPADEVRRMGYDELAAFFRVRHGQLKVQLGGTIQTATPSITSYDAAPPPPDHKPRKRGEPASELLHKLWSTDEGRQRILAAGSAEKIGLLIGKSATSVKEAGPIWDTKIRPALEATRTFVRYHREEERLDG